MKERLKSPSTADLQFPKNRDEIIWWKENTFIVPVTVDAQNSFGATIRQNFGVELEYRGNEKWAFIDITQNFNILVQKKMNTVQ